MYVCCVKNKRFLIKTSLLFPTICVSKFDESIDLQLLKEPSVYCVKSKRCDAQTSGFPTICISKFEKSIDLQLQPNAEFSMNAGNLSMNYLGYKVFCTSFPKLLLRLFCWLIHYCVGLTFLFLFNASRGRIGIETCYCYSRQ